MDTRRLWLVLGFLLLPGEAMAHRHRAGPIFFPRAWLFGSDYTGFSVSGSWPILDCHDLSAVGTFSRYSGTEDGEDFTLLAYMAGVRYTIAPHDSSTWLPFVQLSGGGVDAIQKIGEETSRHRTHGIAALGAGLDYKLRGEGDFHLRFQVDAVRRFSGQTGVAISLGVGWQFGDVKKCP